jgi:hypothetical protein
MPEGLENATSIGALCCKATLVAEWYHLLCERPDPRISGALQGKPARLDFECIAGADHSRERRCIDALLPGSRLSGNKGQESANSK